MLIYENNCGRDQPLSAVTRSLCLESVAFPRKYAHVPWKYKHLPWIVSLPRIKKKILLLGKIHLLCRRNPWKFKTNPLRNQSLKCQPCSVYFIQESRINVVGHQCKFYNAISNFPPFSIVICDIYLIHFSYAQISIIQLCSFKRMKPKSSVES